MLFRTSRDVPDQGGLIDGIASEEDFARVLRRERDRADRTHDEFMLVALEVDEHQRKDPRWCRYLGRVVRSRLRSTDDVGWLPGWRLGIALPHTPEEGAWALVDDMRTRLDRHSESYAPLRFSVYSHTGRGGGPNGAAVAGPRKERPWREPSILAPRHALALDVLMLEPPSTTKRTLDIALSCLGLVVSMPLLAVAGLAIKCTSRGPILFRQLRAGFGGRPFTFYKLRTMVDGADGLKADLQDQNEADGPVFKIEQDPRITLVGRILRKTSIDELPQLWNVLRGDMSLVGPRPPTLDETEKYASWQRRRLHGMGGLTCFWQVKGRSNIGFLDWMRLDLRYLRSRNLLLDLLLIVRTIPAVLAGKGAK